MVQFWLSWFRLAVSSEQKVPLVMFANIVCSSVSRNAGLGGGVGGKRSLLGNSLAGVLVELRTARRHTSHTHWPTGHPKETSSCFPTFIVCTLGMGMYGYTVYRLGSVLVRLGRLTYLFGCESSPISRNVR